MAADSQCIFRRRCLLTASLLTLLRCGSATATITWRFGHAAAHNLWSSGAQQRRAAASGASHQDLGAARERVLAHSGRAGACIPLEGSYLIAPAQKPQRLTAAGYPQSIPLRLRFTTQAGIPAAAVGSGFDSESARPLCRNPEFFPGAIPFPQEGRLCYFPEAEIRVNTAPLTAAQKAAHAGVTAPADDPMTLRRLQTLADNAEILTRFLSPRGLEALSAEAQTPSLLAPGRGEYLIVTSAPLSPISSRC